MLGGWFLVGYTPTSVGSATPGYGARMRDPDRGRVYAAEDEVLAWLTSGEVRIAGETFSPEREARFTGPEEVQRYVDRVLAYLVDGGHRFADRERLAVTIRARRGARRAHYEPDRRVIAVPTRTSGGGWALREHVVLHELAHHLTGPDPSAGAHGADFRATLLRLLEAVGHVETARLLAHRFAAAGLDAAMAASDEPALARIAKLLRQAEATTNEHEREAFLGKAQELATRQSVALALARAHADRSRPRAEPEYRDLVLGTRGQRGLRKLVLLMVAIGSANDVRFTVLRDNTRVTAYGFAADLDVVSALWSSLVVQMVEECERWLDAGQHLREVTRVWSAADHAWVVKTTPTITARLSFYQAYADRIGRRLQQAREQTVAELASTTDRLPVSTALALREKSRAVESYFEVESRRAGARGRWRAATGKGAHSRAGQRAGTRAADRADLTGTRRLGGGSSG